MKHNRSYSIMARRGVMERWSDYFSINAPDDIGAMRHFMRHVLPIASDYQFRLIHRSWAARATTVKTVAQFNKQSALRAYRALYQLRTDNTEVRK